MPNKDIIAEQQLLLKNIDIRNDRLETENTLTYNTPFLLNQSVEYTSNNYTELVLYITFKNCIIPLIIEPGVPQELLEGDVILENYYDLIRVYNVKKVNGGLHLINTLNCHELSEKDIIDIKKHVNFRCI